MTSKEYMEKVMIEEISKEHFVNLDKLNDQSIIVEAGAAWGFIIEKLRNREQTKECEIFAIECNKDNAKTLREKNFHNVTICEKALVGQDFGDSITFYQHLGLPRWGNIFKSTGQGHRKFKGIKKYKVKTLKINDIFSVLRIDKIDFLKMDIEGSEKGIMDTMSEEVASKIDQISVKDYFPFGLPHGYYERIFERLGFKIKIRKKNEIFGERY